MTNALEATVRRRLLLACVSSILAFLGIAGAVMSGFSGPIDRAILLSLRDAADPANVVGPNWLREMARDVTALGSTTVLATVTLTSIGYLLSARRTGLAAYLAASVATAQLLSSGLKWLVDRPRPELPEMTTVFTASFPSGHAFLSTVVYATLAAVLTKAIPGSRRLGIIVASALAFCVGLSRIYLGVHYPSDVAAGWCLGGAVFTGCCALRSGTDAASLSHPR